jgi:hypothetical protein
MRPSSPKALVALECADEPGDLHSARASRSVGLDGGEDESECGNADQKLRRKNVLLIPRHFGKF